MATSFRPARRQNVPLLIGLAGGTGSGKTFSALRLASGIAGPGKRLAAIDTERGRMSYYTDQFQFDVCELEPPFTPKRFLQAMRDAQQADYGCLVVDSASHEWAGQGGVLAMHDDTVDRMAGPNADFKRREALNWPAWKEPKEQHREFVEGLLQLAMPVVLCFRGKVGLKPGVDPETKKKVLLETPFKATTSDDLPFELTTLLILQPTAPGRIDLSQPNKIAKPFAALIRDGALLDEAFGAELAAWARGGPAAGAAKPLPEKAAFDAARVASDPTPSRRRTYGEAAAELRSQVEAMHDLEALEDLLAAESTRKLLEALGDRAGELNQAIAARLQLLQPAHEGAEP